MGKTPSWAELIAIYRPGDRADAEWGEVRDERELTRLPRNARLRAALLDDAAGTVLRWVKGDSLTAAKELGGYYHSYLLRGEGGAQALCGWLTLSSKGVPKWR